MQKSDVAGRARPSETSPSEAVTKLNEIIERMEAAPEGSMGLSRQVALAIGWGKRKQPGKKAEWFHPDDMLPNGNIAWDSLHGTDTWREPLDYTRSLDAALTLVLNKRIWAIEMVTGRPEAMVAGECAHGATPAIALCIAALRARASRDTPSSPEETEASQAKPPHTPVED